MINDTEPYSEYLSALRQGQKYYRTCVAKGTYPYPRVLSEMTGENSASGQIKLGTLEIPMERIVGTLAEGRKAAFAGNFMPLLPVNSEFASKWISLCSAHLSPKGIVEPITCIEYMGCFYVQEGHKRVSVLRYFGAPTVRARVYRLLPRWSEEPEVRAYAEFLQFFRLTRMYQVLYTKPGRYQRLLKALGASEDQIWTDEQRSVFLAFFWKMQALCRDEITQWAPATFSDLLLVYLEAYPYGEAEQDRDELHRRLTALLPDARLLAEREAPEVSTEPQIQEKSILGHWLEELTHSMLKIAFIYASDPVRSIWSRSHDLGREYLESALSDRVNIRTYRAGTDADEAFAQAVGDGAQMIFATAPTLLGAARRAAAAHPQVRVLVCSLSVPYTGIRTYYSRIHEAKFIIGALAGSVWRGGDISYVARYPILGVPAAVNAFALGLRMTAPDARVRLVWSSVEGEVQALLNDRNVRIISGYETSAVENPDDFSGWSTVILQNDGRFLPLASACWNWGKMYEQLVLSVTDGGWDAANRSAGNAFGYWWGMDSGVIDVQLSEQLPPGTAQLGRILKQGLSSGETDPFAAVLRDQRGNVRAPKGECFEPEELMRMDWLLENVDGRIPAVSELMSVSRETARLLTLHPEEGAAEE